MVSECVDYAQGSYEEWLRVIIRTRDADGQGPLVHSAQAAGRVAQTRWALGPFFVPAVLGEVRQTGYEYRRIAEAVVKASSGLS